MMTPAATFIGALLLFAAGGLGAGCSSDAHESAALGAGGIDGGAGSAVAGSDGAGGEAADGTAGAGGGDLVTGVRVFSGTARVLANGPACTGEVGALGDRWCAFITFTDATQEARSLYVFNATHAAAGQPVSCGAADGGADTNCLRLTASLGGDSGSPVLHGTFFQGDSIVYYENQEGVLAPYIWRPGMTRGRRLATVPAGHEATWCTPSPKGTAVSCVILPLVDPDPNVGFGDLLIGKADGANEPLLSPADTVITFSLADAGFGGTFSFGFPPGPGDHVAWTTRDGASGPETLKLQSAGDPASKVTIASDVRDWDFSPDAAHWFWLTTAGTLQTAPFPGGADPTDLVADVIKYRVSSGGRDVVALTKDGALVAIVDPFTPASELLLDTGVKAMLSPLSAAGHVAYAKQLAGTTSGDLYVNSADGTASCVVEVTHPVPFPAVSFAPNAGAILWASSPAGDAFEAHYTRLRDCNTMPIAADVTLIQSIGNTRVLFADQFDDATVSGSLRVRLVANGNSVTADSPISIADRADSYAITGPSPDALVYTVNTGGANDGVYVRGFAD
jgi:hypothetical protein